MATRLNPRNALTVGSLAVLVGTEVVGATLATAWAVAGLLELGSGLGTALIVLGGLVGLAATAAFVRGALRVEPAVERA